MNIHYLRPEHGVERAQGRTLPPSIGVLIAACGAAICWIALIGVAVALA